MLLVDLSQFFFSSFETAIAITTRVTLTGEKKGNFLNGMLSLEEKGHLFGNYLIGMFDTKTFFYHYSLSSFNVLIDQKSLLQSPQSASSLEICCRIGALDFFGLSLQNRIHTQVRRVGAEQLGSVFQGGK